MQPYQAGSAALPRRNRNRGTNYHLALAALADDVVGMLARLFVYVGVLALFAILGLAALEQLPRVDDAQAALDSVWAMNDPCAPANQVNFPTRSARYSVSRRPAGESGDDAGERRQACPPDWLRDREALPLRGPL